MENISTFDRLLRIQGNPKQTTLADGMEASRSPAPPVPPKPATMMRQSEPETRKISIEEVEAWRTLYRFYAKFVPLIREAALLDDEGNERALEVFGAVSMELPALYEQGGIVGKALSVPVYELMSSIYEEERSRRQVF